VIAVRRARDAWPGPNRCRSRALRDAKLGGNRRVTVLDWVIGVSLGAPVSFGRNPLQFRVDVGLYSHEFAEMFGVFG
jgi:hypothetical protein